MTFVARVPLRWVDLDAQGHVNNALIVDYLQEARTAYLLSGPHGRMLGEGVVVVGHQVEYLRPTEFSRTPLTVELTVGGVGASKITYGYEVVQDGIPVARARTVVCPIDFAANRPRRLRDEERASFKDAAGRLEPFRDLGRWRVGEEAHVHEFTVRWSDVDSYGHVNNVRFFDYIAEARVHMSADGDPLAVRTAANDDAGYLWLVVRQDVDYLAQLPHRLEPYVVRTAIARLGTTSMTTVAEITDPSDGRVFARSRTVIVTADRRGRPVAVPEQLRHALDLWPAVNLG
jgi:acyl-CoA thioester hydrolase